MRSERNPSDRSERKYLSGFMLTKILLVAIGGGLGSVCRFLVSAAMPKFALTSRWGVTSFPLATFSVNILGCFLVGLISAYFNSHSNLPPNLKLLLITGFCGGFTTFSTFAFEKANMLQNGNYATFFLYVFSSVILGILAVFLGFWVGAGK